MPNKAKLGKAGVSGGWHVGQMRQTNPMSAGQARCTNKANFPAGPLVQTKPIPRSGVDPGQIVRNEPNLSIADSGPPCGRTPPADRRRKGRLCKQTQFGPARPVSGGRLCQTKPNLGDMGYLGSLSVPWPEPIMQNKPNFGWSARQGPNAPNKPNSRRGGVYPSYRSQRSYALSSRNSGRMCLS
jgi:hypothetical protein